MRECIVLAACGAHEVLPQHPDLPADVFTAALTTPIKVALRWFCSRSLLRNEGLTKVRRQPWARGGDAEKGEGGCSVASVLGMFSSPIDCLMCALRWPVT